MPLGYGGVASIVVVVVVRQLFSLRQNDLDYQDYTVLAWSGELKEFSFQSTIATDVAGGRTQGGKPSSTNYNRPRRGGINPEVDFHDPLSAKPITHGWPLVSDVCGGRFVFLEQ